MKEKLFEKKYKAELIYRATEDGFGFYDAKPKIINQKNLLHLFKVKGNEKRFGALNDITFKDKNYEYEWSDNTFLIQIDQ